MAGTITMMRQPRAIAKRQAWLEREGYRVIRFWNSDVVGNLNAVMEQIYVEVYGAREAEALPLKHHRRR